MLEVLTAHPDFENTQADGGFAPRPDFRPLTRFEGQGLDKGHSYTTCSSAAAEN